MIYNPQELPEATLLKVGRKRLEGRPQPEEEEVVHISNGKSIWDGRVWFPVPLCSTVPTSFPYTASPFVSQTWLRFLKLFLYIVMKPRSSHSIGSSLAHLESPVTFLRLRGGHSKRRGRGKASSWSSVTTDAINKPCPLHSEMFPPLRKKRLWISKDPKNKSKT